MVIGTDPRNGQVRVTLRYDVPDPGHPAVTAALAKHAVSLLDAQGVTAAVAVGYGTDAGGLPRSPPRCANARPRPGSR